MSVNSSALIRFQVYDKCLRSIRREYTREDILNELRKAENREGKKSRGGKERIGIEINNRQFYKDLQTIEEVWGIEIERRVAHGRHKIYRYRNPAFSMFANLPKDNHLIKLRDTLFVLQQFRGLPHFRFLDDLFQTIEGADGSELDRRIIVDFDGNPDVKGLDHFSNLLNAIQLKKVLKIKYNMSFRKKRNIIISPYFLKEYGNRWFLLGTEKGYKSISNIALDRIESLDFAKGEKYTETEVDFANDYFENVIGVTVPKNAELIRVVLKFSRERFAYVESKPLHGSQKSDRKKRTVTIEVFHNRELESLILHYGNDVEVIEPESLREAIRNRILTMYNSYKKDGRD
jgi:predicted DNA-binding transcriptional regulator YafY